MVYATNSTQALSDRPSQRSIAIVCIFFIWVAGLMVGQVGRIPVFGQSGGLLISDFANIVVIVYAYLCYVMPDLIRHPRRRRFRLGGRNDNKRLIGISVFAITPFLLWSLFTLLLHYHQLPANSLLVSLAYWLRLVTILALLPAFLYVIPGLAQDPRRKLICLIFSFLVTALVTLGYLQLIIRPSLQGLSGGWDPHNFRMVGTWLDPNFFGAFLAMTLPYVFVVGKSGKRLGLTEKPQALRRLAVGIFIFIAIILTQSRSTFIAILIAVILCGILWLLPARIPPIGKKIAGVSIFITCLLIVMGVMLLGNRGIGTLLHDPTVAVRIAAYKATWRNLVEPNIAIGVGYNAYQFAAKDAGLISDFSLHSRAGSDSSVLTLLVTTGIIGTALFFAPIFIAVTFHVRRFFQAQNYYSLCFLFATIVLLVHSQFTNSLLYPHLLMTYIFLVAISFVYE